MSEKRSGYICPEWAESRWSRDDSMILKTASGGYAVVCNETQTTIYLGTTKADCETFLGSRPEVYNDEENE